MAVEPKNDFKLLSDEPILETERFDNLEFNHAAEVLALAALHTHSPITLGIFGDWGSGKTSFMRLMKKVIEEKGVGENAAVPVWFNAWQYEREEHLIIPLIATIAREITNRSETWGEIMKTGGEKVHNALRSVLYGISMKGKLGVPSLGDIEISASMKDMIARYEAVTQDTLMKRSLYFDAFDQLHDISRGKEDKPQIVVFVDDLDRCFPEQAVRLLESIKLILHQPNFAFVLGIFPQIIEEFIRNKYAAQYPLAAIKASSSDDYDFSSRMNQYLNYFNNYLGKIIQVKYYVPEREPKQMHAYIKNLLEDAGVIDQFRAENIADSDLFELIAEVGRRNPREIVRKVNNLIVNWRIAKREENQNKTFDLLAGLIAELISERMIRSKNEYATFLDRLEWLTGSDEDSPCYGKQLAEKLETIPAETMFHQVKIEKLKADLDIEKDATLISLIAMLDKDEHLCNVLISPPGRRWLSDKTYRTVTRKTFREKTEVETPKASAPKQRHDLDNIIKGLKLIPIPAGEFMMGSPNDEDGRSDDEKLHPVKLSAFEMSATLVTQAQYEAIMGNNPSHFKGEKDDSSGNLPVENVSWEDALVFCDQLTKRSNRNGRFTLPTEAQWEYAARAGTNTPFNTGENLTTDQANYDGNYPYKNFPKGKFLEKTTPVGSYPPNAWGLYDMHGNVWEWCLDWLGEKYYDECLQQGTVENPTGPATGSFRVIRGGSWDSRALYCRCAPRNGLTPGYRNYYVGFRLVFVPQAGG